MSLSKEEMQAPGRLKHMKAAIQSFPSQHFAATGPTARTLHSTQDYRLDNQGRTTSDRPERQANKLEFQVNSGHSLAGSTFGYLASRGATVATAFVPSHPKHQDHPEFQPGPVRDRMETTMNSSRHGDPKGKEGPKMAKSDFDKYMEKYDPTPEPGSSKAKKNK